MAVSNKTSMVFNLVEIKSGDSVWKLCEKELKDAGIATTSENVGKYCKAVLKGNDLTAETARQLQPGDYIDLNCFGDDCNSLDQFIAKQASDPVKVTARQAARFAPSVPSEPAESSGVSEKTVEGKPFTVADALGRVGDHVSKGQANVRADLDVLLSEEYLSISPSKVDRRLQAAVSSGAVSFGEAQFFAIRLIEKFAQLDAERGNSLDGWVDLANDWEVSDDIDFGTLKDIAAAGNLNRAQIADNAYDDMKVAAARGDGPEFRRAFTRMQKGDIGRYVNSYKDELSDLRDLLVDSESRKLGFIREAISAARSGNEERLNYILQIELDRFVVYPSDLDSDLRNSLISELSDAVMGKKSNAQTLLTLVGNLGLIGKQELASFQVTLDS